jgi:hypothetical protein
VSRLGKVPEKLGCVEVERNALTPLGATGGPQRVSPSLTQPRAEYLPAPLAVSRARCQLVAALSERLGLPEGVAFTWKKGAGLAAAPFYVRSVTAR